MSLDRRGFLRLLGAAMVSVSLSLPIDFGSETEERELTQVEAFSEFLVAQLDHVFAEDLSTHRRFSHYWIAD